MATYTLNVNIDPKSLPEFNLQANTYMLCVAKKMGDNAYNIVFQAKKPLTHNKFTWTEKYQLQATTDTFTPGQAVVSDNDPIDIHFGETMGMDAAGTQSVKHDSKLSPGTFAFDNDFTDNISVIVSCSVGGDKFLPVYVTPNMLAQHSKDSFTPLPQVVVWLQQNIKTSTMLSTITTDMIEVPYRQGATNHTVSLSYDRVWSGEGDVIEA